MSVVKYRHVSGMNLFAILGFSIICGCSGLGAKKIERPEVPSDFPFAVVWLQPNKTTRSLDALTERELLGLVMVKKWNEGDRDFVGYSTYDGRFYLHYPDVVYIKWETTQLPDGSITKYAAMIYGPGDNTVVDEVIGSFYRSLLTFFILPDIVNNNREIISLCRFVADVAHKMEGRR